MRRSRTREVSGKTRRNPDRQPLLSEVETSARYRMNLSIDFKTNLAQLPEVEGISAIELIYKDTGEPCGHFLVYSFSCTYATSVYPVSRGGGSFSIATLRGRAVFSPSLCSDTLGNAKKLLKHILQNVPIPAIFSILGCQTINMARPDLDSQHPYKLCLCAMHRRYVWCMQLCVCCAHTLRHTHTHTHTHWR